MTEEIPIQILPMVTAGTHHLIERTYRESGTYQWVREALKNAIEAGATRIEFGIEWQAVESLGVYRRTIADNGCGMTADQLVGFFNTFGSGGKPIGGVHQNFGVGSKTSLLPWNRFGMVVVSWVDGSPSMIWVARNPATGEYGLKVEKCEGEQLDAVYDPYAEHGVDWLKIKPDWIEDHGTVIVLLGNTPRSDTVTGDPNRSEADIKGIASYLNRRMWDLPPGVGVHVDELRTNNKADWPNKETEAHGAIPQQGKDRRTNLRKVEGARYYIEYQQKRFTKGSLSAKGTVELADTTVVDWYLWQGERPKIHSYAACSGYIAVLYDSELYDITSHHATYRTFGIGEQSVRNKVWLIIRPPIDSRGDSGVYPRQDRNALLLDGHPLPINDWGAEFSDNMPEELVEAIRQSRTGEDGTIEDEFWRNRLAERFGTRWKIPKLRPDTNGDELSDRTEQEADSQSADTAEGNTDSGSDTGSPSRRPRYGRSGKTDLANKEETPGGLPIYRTVGADAVGAGMIAAWQPHDPEHPEGVVLLNVEHPVVASVVAHWQSQYPAHHSEGIARDVQDIYGQVAVAKVAHSEHLKGILPSPTIEDELRSEQSLTMALLGLMAEDGLISSRIAGKYRRRRRT